MRCLSCGGFYRNPASSQRWYHGSPSIEFILEKGFDIDAKRIRDPGDFGWGIYLTTQPARAKVCAGDDRILEVEIDTTNYAYISCPYFLYSPNNTEDSSLWGKRMQPSTEAEELFFNIAFRPSKDWRGRAVVQNRLVRGKEREKAAKEMRAAFIAAGYDGIISDIDEGEAVIFDIVSVISIKEIKA